MRYTLTILFVLIIGGQAAPAWPTLPSRTNSEPAFVFTPSPADWRDQNLYYIMTDRFFDGDTSNNLANSKATFNPSGSDTLHGGDFKGIEQKLDYLELLGVKGIIISPVARNRWGAYHGYAAGDLNQIDPHWGDLEDLRDMIDAAHDRGIYVLFDMVVNHLVDLIDSADAGYPAFSMTEYTPRWKPSVGTERHTAPFAAFSNFYHHGETEDWENQTQAELGDYPGLDSLRTESAQVRTDLTTIYKALISATDCDGFRADTARHVEMGFWDAFLPPLHAHAATLGKTNFLIIPEAPVGDETAIGPYTHSNRFNSAYHFPMNGTMDAVFIDAGDTGRLAYHLQWDRLQHFSDEARYQLVNFLDHHDTERYMHSSKLNQDARRMKQALAYLFTSLQIPYLYYGNEQGFDGGDDPNNREDMFDGQFESGASEGDNFDAGHELFVWVRKLNLLREAYPALRKGDFIERWNTYPSGGSGIFVYSKTLGGQELIIALNTAATACEVSDGTYGAETAQTEGTVLVNLLAPDETVVVGQYAGESHRVSFWMPSYGVKIFCPQGDLVATAPVLLGLTPSHGQTNVPRSTTINLCFDQTMDTTSVESALSTVPAASGTFSWHDGNRRVVFSPTALLAATSSYTLALAGTAQGTNGLAIGLDASITFQTGMATTNPVQTFGPAEQLPGDGSVTFQDPIRISTFTEPPGAASVVRFHYSIDGGGWSNLNMICAGQDNGRERWEAEIGPYDGTTAIAYFLEADDGDGATITDNNGGGNYSTSVNTAPAVQWIGATYHWPPDGEIDSWDDLWINTETWPAGAATFVRLIYNINGGDWQSGELSDNGSANDNDAWNINLGAQAAGATVRYALEAGDGNGDSLWDNNGSQNYSASVSAGAPLEWVGNTYHWPFDGQIEASDDLWINTESWPAGAGQSAAVVYSSDGGTTWSQVSMSANGQVGANDAWNVNLGAFGAGTTIEYALRVVDGQAVEHWDNNDSQNYTAEVTVGVVYLPVFSALDPYRFDSEILRANDCAPNPATHELGEFTAGQSITVVARPVENNNPEQVQSDVTMTSLLHYTLTGDYGDQVVVTGAYHAGYFDSQPHFDYFSYDLGVFTAGDSMIFWLEAGNSEGDGYAQFAGEDYALTVTSGSVDSDNDGLPDSWELDQFSDLDENATGNPDGDGPTGRPLDNMIEYTLGLDPNIPNDPMGIRLLWSPSYPMPGQQITLSYFYVNESNPLYGKPVYGHIGKNGWDGVYDTEQLQLNTTISRFETVITVPTDATSLNAVFHDNAGTWDNNDGADWTIPVQP